MIATAGPVVVIGMGNVLLGDDGVGVRLVEGLRALADEDPRALADEDPRAVPPGTRLVDGGTLGLDLLGMVRDAGSLLLLDAVDLGGEPGAVCVLRGDAIHTGRGRAGGVGELLAAARLMGWLPPEVALVGVQAANLGPGLGLSPAVAAALPAALEAARRELIAIGARTASGPSKAPAIRRQGEATA